MARNLTDRQKKFLDVLFEEANGDAVTAKKLAGYSDNTPTVDIIFTDAPNCTGNGTLKSCLIPRAVSTLG